MSKDKDEARIMIPPLLLDKQPWQKDILDLIDYLTDNNLKLVSHPRGGYKVIPKDAPEKRTLYRIEENGMITEQTFDNLTKFKSKL